MLRKIKFGLLAIFLFLFFSGILKNNIFDTPQNAKKKISGFLETSAGKTIEGNVFARDKTLSYKMYAWSLIPMGEMKFTTRALDSGYDFSFEALSRGSFVERFITARARVGSLVSKENGLPYKYIEKTDVRGKIKTKEIRFDHENLIATRGDRKTKIPENTYDPVSAFVMMLTRPLEIGEEHKTKFISGDDVYLLRSVTLNKAKGIAEILIDMKRENLTSSHGGTLHVWVTDDNSRIPLVFKSWTPAGYASVVLERIE